MAWNVEYEYICIEVNWLLKDATELNKYAKEGWELITIASDNIFRPPVAIFRKVKD